jgi:hypothetical protein
MSALRAPFQAPLRDDIGLSHHGNHGVVRDDGCGTSP